jgi:hypothetical protein
MPLLLAEITTVVVVLVVVLRLEAVYRATRAFRGARALLCPVDGAPAAVELSMWRAAVTAFFGRTRLRPERCTRWKLGVPCEGACAAQIEASPRSGLARVLVSGWTAGRACAVCGYELGRSGDFPAALLSADGSSVEWRSIRLEELTNALRTHRPICWHCHVVRSLRRARPDLFVSRPGPADQDSGLKRGA